MRLLACLLLTTSTLLAQDAPNYTEPHRPQFHFTPAKNWMNDPNGMVYYEGEYHLFYQYNPFGDKWGHMSWGHAVSQDMVHWEHLPLALAEENNVMIFSGSAVVDWKNTSGFGKDGKPPMVAIYTGHHTDKKLQDQRIAYSNDKGRTWTKYAENPVIDIGYADFRDPKVFWHEGTNQWVMIVTLSKESKLRLYGSANLKDWSKLSDFGPHGCTKGVWECPDLFELPVEGSDEKKWVIILNIGGGAAAGGSGCQYFIGDFDGKSFNLHEPSLPALKDGSTESGVWADYGRDFYAAVSWSDIPKEDGRRIWIGWMSNWEYAQDVPTSPWRSAMTVPRTLTLRKVGEAYRLIQTPVKELAILGNEGATIKRPRADQANALIKSLDSELLDIDLVLDADQASEITLTKADSGKAVIRVDAKAGTLSFDRSAFGATGFNEHFPGTHTSPLRSTNGAVNLRLIIDRSSIELIGNDGESVISDLFFAKPGTVQLHFDKASVLRITAHKLKSAWK